MVYEVLVVPRAELGGMWGDVSYGLQRIRVADDLTPQAQSVALLHELMHVADHVLDAGLEEENVTRLSHVLWAMISDNPSLGSLIWGDGRRRDG
jgi:hypothetical protein